MDIKLVLASDHGGYKLKQSILEYLKNKGYNVEDCGTYSEDSCDYPDYIFKASQKVSKGEAARAVVICTTGIGASIVANKVDNIRCALCLNLDQAEMSRRHNDANVLALGAKYIASEDAFQMLDIWLKTEFEGGRHKRRVDKINNYRC